MELTDKQLEYLELNRSIFGSNAATEEQRMEAYSIYNYLTGENKKPNSCGRCWRNVKNRVYQQYKIQSTYENGGV